MRRSIIVAIAVLVVLGLSFGASAHEIRVSYNVTGQTLALGGLAMVAPSVYLSGDISFIPGFTVIEAGAYYAVVNDPGLRVGIGGGISYIPMGPAIIWFVGADAMYDLGGGFFVAGSAAFYQFASLVAEGGVGYSFGDFFVKLSYSYHKPYSPFEGVVITAGMYL